MSIYKNKIAYMNIILIAIVSLFFVSNTIAQNQIQENYDIISSNIEFEKVNKIENILKDLSIQYKIEKDNIGKYNLLVKDEYKAYTLIKLSQYYNEEQKIINDNSKLISDTIKFENDIINVFIKDYCNKISKYKETNDKFYEDLLFESEKSLEYYISRQLYSIPNIINSKIKIIYNDNGIFNFSMIIDTTKSFDESKINTIRQFFTDTINGIHIENEIVNNNQIIFEGNFDWKVSNYSYDILKIEYENKKSKELTKESSGGGSKTVKQTIKEN